MFSLQILLFLINADQVSGALQAKSTSLLSATQFDVIVDVRSASEWNAGHVAGAVWAKDGATPPHASLSVLDDAFSDKTCFPADKFPNGKASLRVLVYCKSSIRAKTAGEKLEALGYTTIVRQDTGEGFTDLKSWGFPVVSAANYKGAEGYDDGYPLDGASSLVVLKKRLGCFAGTTSTTTLPGGGAEKETGETKPTSETGAGKSDSEAVSGAMFSRGTPATSVVTVLVGFIWMLC